MIIVLPKIHSFVDVITNSSSELFVFRNDRLDKEHLFISLGYGHLSNAAFEVPKNIQDILTEIYNQYFLVERNNDFSTTYMIEKILQQHNVEQPWFGAEYINYFLEEYINGSITKEKRDEIFSPGTIIVEIEDGQLWEDQSHWDFKKLTEKLSIYWESRR